MPFRSRADTGGAASPAPPLGVAVDIRSGRLLSSGGALDVPWRSTRDDLAKAHAELSELKAADAELKNSRAVRRLDQGFPRCRRRRSDMLGRRRPRSPGAAAGLPRSEPVPYGELPFDRTRLDVLRDLLDKSGSSEPGFPGVLKIISSPGMFCLAGNASDGFGPARAARSVSKCDLLGNPFDDSLSGQQRQSLAFANLVAGVQAAHPGAITVVFENAASARAAIPDPARTETLTAGNGTGRRRRTSGGIRRRVRAGLERDRAPKIPAPLELRSNNPESPVCTDSSCDLTSVSQAERHIGPKPDRAHRARRSPESRPDPSRAPSGTHASVEIESPAHHPGGRDAGRRERTGPARV